MCGFYRVHFAINILGVRDVELHKEWESWVLVGVLPASSEGERARQGTNNAADHSRLPSSSP
jgi:hypothetical protein